MSGHSKYANIKHRKNQQDSKRSKMFMTLLKHISIEAKNNNNINTNPKLRVLVKNAKKANIPKDRIEKALNIDNKINNIRKVVFECFLKNNLTCIVICTTSNFACDYSKIKKIFNKFNIKVGEKNSLKAYYKNIFQISCSINIPEETVEDIILNTPLESYKKCEKDELYYFNYELNNSESAIIFFENISHNHSHETYIPYDKVMIDDSDQKRTINKFLDSLYELDFVDDVITNFII